MAEREIIELSKKALEIGDAAGNEDIPVGQIRALYASGVTTELIARSLGVTEATVKLVVNADHMASCANGTITFTQEDLATVKTRIMQAVTGGSENVSAKVAMWVADKHMVSADTKLRIEKGVNNGNVVAVNIQNVLQEAAQAAKRHV